MDTPLNGSSTFSSTGGRRNVRPARRQLLLRGAAAAAAILLGLAILAAPAARFLIVRAEPLHADVVVALSGSAVYEERVRFAISAFRQGRAHAIVLTNDGLRGRWSRRRQANLTSIQRAKDALVDAGIPEERLVLLEPRVTSTYDEALTVRQYVERKGLKRVLVVTSPYHSRRALWVFRRVLGPAGVTVGIDSPLPGEQSPRPAEWWLSRAGWHSVALEYAKLVYYYVKHG